MLFDPRALRFLCDVAGADKVVLGSDYPLPIGGRKRWRIIDETSLTEPERRAILGETAARIYRLRLPRRSEKVVDERTHCEKADGVLKKLCLAIGCLGLTAGVSTAAQAQGGVRVGTLTCNVASGWGFVFGSSKALRCTFAPAPGRAEFYAGTINKFGVDIGYTQGGVLVWAVFAPTANLGPGALNGDYVGATGSATVGVGAGANVLVGGSNLTISLQPVSVEGNTGLNVAAGIGSISLRYQPQTARHRH